MTRFEKIKAMTIEEMAKAIDEHLPELMDDICIGNKDCPYMDEDGYVSDNCDCTGCVVKWLESEVTE